MNFVLQKNLWCLPDAWARGLGPTCAVVNKEQRKLLHLCRSLPVLLVCVWVELCDSSFRLAYDDLLFAYSSCNVEESVSAFDYNKSNSTIYNIVFLLFIFIFSLRNMEEILTAYCCELAVLYLLYTWICNCINILVRNYFFDHLIYD